MTDPLTDAVRAVDELRARHPDPACPARAASYRTTAACACREERRPAVPVADFVRRRRAQ